MKHNSPAAVGLAALLASMALTSCSGLRGSGSEDSSASDTIRIMNVGPQKPSAAFGGVAFPYGATGVQAAAAAINAAGGIDGRKIVVDVCDTKGSANGSAACGRTAVSTKAVAVVGTFDPLGAPQLLSVLEPAGIPYIGGLPTSTAEFTSPVSFQFDPGPILAGTGFSQLWSDQGCRKVAAILPANPGQDKIAEQVKLQSARLNVATITQLVQPGVADITPSLSTALAAKPDCFTYAGDGQTNVKYIQALRKQGFKGKIMTSSGSLTPQFLRPLGAAGNGIIILNSTLQPTSGDPMVKQFMTDLASQLKGDQQQIAINANEFAQDGWSSVQLVKQALTGVSDPSAKTLLAKIPTMCDVNLGNVYPHVNFCQPVTQSALVPRLYNNSWQYFVVKNGQYEPSDGTWHDLTATVPGSQPA